MLVRLANDESARLSVLAHDTYWTEMNLVELAQRIKSIRLARKLTLDDVAKRAGMTRGWLSKVENFRVTPSLPALGEIAKALGVTVAQLVEGLDESPRLVIVHKNERKVVERDRSEGNTAVYESLAHKRANRAMDPFEITVPPKSGRRVALSHEGEEFLIVLSGGVNFEYDGEVCTLAAGDSIYFDARVKHRLINPHAKPARVLCVFHEPRAE